MTPISKRSSGNSRVVKRLFIDPASISTGWALFHDKKLVKSGTIAVDRKLDIFDRLWEVFHRYSIKPFNVDEVHIEQLVRNTHIYTHWSVACIGIALVSRDVKVFADIPIQSWQKHCAWKTTKKGLKGYKRRAKSEDELAAIGMGLWYLSKLTN